MESVFSTVLAGVFVFVLGQIFLKLIIEPAQELKRTLGAVSHILLVHQAKLTNATSDRGIADEVRAKSAEIVSKHHTILWYPLTRLLFGLPSKQALLSASMELNSIHYGMLPESKEYESSVAFNGKKTDFALQNVGAMSEVARLLRIKTSYAVSD